VTKKSALCLAYWNPNFCPQTALNGKTCGQKQSKHRDGITKQHRILIHIIIISSCDLPTVISDKYRNGWT